MENNELKDTEWLSPTKPESEGVTRRTVLTAAMTAGFALAVQPVSAETIITDTKGLSAGMVTFKGADGVSIPAYFAVPEKIGKRKPGIVLVVQEIFGVHEHIKDVCRRFAKQGYFAIAPELYVRQGSVADKPMNEIFPIVGKVPDAQVLSDLDAAVYYAASTGKADSSRVAVTGFCWGGRITWLYAAHNPKVKAGGAWYGRLAGQGTELQPKSPTELAAQIKAPVLGLYGAKDRGIPLESIEGMRAALKAAGNTKSEIIVYPDSEHGFHADYRPSYNEKDAKDAFAKLLAWFKRNGMS